MKFHEVSKGEIDLVKSIGPDWPLFRDERLNLHTF